jgi:CHAD domain-containing protein
MEHWHHLEREVKLDVNADWSLPDLTGVIAGAEVRALPTLLLETTYYDTADRRLEKRRIALRYRRQRAVDGAGEDRSGYAVPSGLYGAGRSEERLSDLTGSHSEWTVKLPPDGEAPALARTEVNWPAQGHQGEEGTPTPPVEVVRLLAAVALGEPFFAVARLSSARRRTEVMVASRRAAEVDDDTVEGTAFVPGTSTARSPTLTFREVEVELEEGSPEDLLRSVVKALVAAGARRSSRRSKLATVLQSAAQSGAGVGEAGVGEAGVGEAGVGEAGVGEVPAPRARGATRKPKKALTMADVLQEQARTCLDAIAEHDPPVRLGDPDPEHLHKARVATRRLRSVLWALRRLQGPSVKPGGASDQVSAFNLAREASERLPSTGVPSTGVPSTGVPSTGVPSTGVPSTGVPSTGVPSPGVPSPGVPSPGVPSPGVPSPGVPSPGVPSPGVPSPGEAGSGGGFGAQGASAEGELVALTAHGWMATLRKEMRWVGNALGAARDADVRLTALEAECARLGPLDQRGVERVLSAARSEQAAAHQRLLEVMASDRYVAALRSLEALARRSEAVPAELWEHLNVPAAAAMARLGGAQWRSVRRAVRRLGTSPSDEALHKLRIQAKRLRYISEAAAPVIRPAPSRRAVTSMAAAATGLQDVLGALHDAVVSEHWLRDLASRPLSSQNRLVDEHDANEHNNGVVTGSTEVALVAGQLIAAFRFTASSCRATWTEDWHRLARKDLARWLSA